MADFLKEISNPQFEKIKYETMVNIILIHSANVNDDSIQLTAMTWLRELTNLLGERALFFMPGILNVTLPCLSYGDENLKKNIKDQARAVNVILWSLIDKTSTTDIETASPLNSKTNHLAIDKVVESLSRLMVTPTDPATVLTTIGSLRWMQHLVNKQADTLLHVDDFFNILIQFLSDPSKEVVPLFSLFITIMLSYFSLMRFSFKGSRNWFENTRYYIFECFYHKKVESRGNRQRAVSQVQQLLC